MSGQTIEVKNVSLSTTKKGLEDFFSFCGTINKLDLEKDSDGQSQKATVNFDKATAASTAVMLNGGTLDGSQLSVTLPGSSASLSNPTDDSTNTNSLGQEDKPRTAIVAEYLAHGYALSDDITKRAIELDSKHGLSTRFKSYLSSLDRSLGQRVASASSSSDKKLTESNEHTPSGNVASEAVIEKDASKTPVPGSNPNDLGPKTTTQVPGATSTTQEPSLARTVQERANQVLERPEIKEKTTFAWSKLTEYYNAIANHPRIHSFYSNASKTVSDVHEEAKRIAEEKKRTGNASTGAAGTSIGQMSALPLLLLLLFSSIVVPSVVAHGSFGEDNIKPAEVAGEKPHPVGKESYVQKHMASEHHIGAFDMGSFFALHDLDRNGILDRSEIEAIYGVHHSTSIKHSDNYEVHDQKAETIVKEVLKRLDKNYDGVLTKAEFVAGGADGLPSFEQFGKGVLGHHYDEESEYFVHHEEIYHNTPETQTDEAYNHPADIEHFAHHDKIEKEEEIRERKAEGMPTIEQELAAKEAAQAAGKQYVSPYENQMDPKKVAEADAAQKPDAGYAASEAKPGKHVFHTPEGVKVVQTTEEKHLETLEKHGSLQQPGETEEGFKQRLQAIELLKAQIARDRGVDPKDSDKNFDFLSDDKGPVVASPAAVGSKEYFEQQKLKQQPGESDETYKNRLKAKNSYLAKTRPDFGSGEKGWARPLDDADRLRKGAPYKYPPIQPKNDQYRVKKQSYFGEF